MRLTVFYLLASALSPSLAHSQGPVFTTHWRNMRKFRKPLDSMIVLS